MTLPLLSIIVPIYNVEKYLKQCIDSILMQTMTDYEIILVDDGSPDNCGIICDDYANKYENVHTFHKENGGLSNARNFGIQKAQGEYLIFIDSDDYYDDQEFFSKIKESIDRYNHPTMINFSYRRYLEASGEFLQGVSMGDIEKLNNINPYEELIKYLIEKDLLAISACSKTIKRSYIIEKNLFFKTGIVSEDFEWSMRLYAEPFNMKFINSDAYIYRTGRKGSISNTIRKKNLLDLLQIIADYSNVFLKSQSSLCFILLNYLAYQYAILCGLTVRLKNKEEKKQILELIKKYKWILNYSLSPKVKKASKCCRIFGIKNTAFILGIYIEHGRNRK